MRQASYEIARTLRPCSTLPSGTSLLYAYVGAARLIRWGNWNMIRETTYTGARKNLAALMDQVTDTHEPVLIRRRGKEPVALVAAEDLSSWMETDYLLRSPKNAQRLQEAMARADAGQGEPVDLEELRRQLGLVEE